MGHAAAAAGRARRGQDGACCRASTRPRACWSCTGSPTCARCLARLPRHSPSRCRIAPLILRCDRLGAGARRRLRHRRAAARLWRRLLRPAAAVAAKRRARDRRRVRSADRRRVPAAPHDLAVQAVVTESADPADRRAWRPQLRRGAFGNGFHDVVHRFGPMARASLRVPRAAMRCRHARVQSKIGATTTSLSIAEGVPHGHETAISTRRKPANGSTRSTACSSTKGPTARIS